MQHLLLETIKHHLIDDNCSLKSIDYQKRELKANALQAWEQRFYNSLHSSQIYNSILTGPPDGKLPMVLQIASSGYHTKDQTYEHQVPRDIQLTLFCLAMGHAFTGVYRLRFRQDHLSPAWEEVACECGATPEDTEHVLLHCPLTQQHCWQLLLSEGPLDSLRKLFDHPERCQGLLRFLKTMRVCVKPQTVWEPG